MNEYQWSEWLENTPGPCPVPVGTWIEVSDGVKVYEGRVTSVCRQPFNVNHGSWMHFPGYQKIIRYRYRISAHLIEMRQKAADLTSTKSPDVAQ